MKLVDPGKSPGILCLIEGHPLASAWMEKIRDHQCREAVKHRQAAVVDPRLDPARARCSRGRLRVKDYCFCDVPGWDPLEACPGVAPLSFFIWLLL